MEYRKFTLSPGQQAPEGSTGTGMPDGSIVWIGKEGTFPKVATTDPNEKKAKTTYDNNIMTQKEIDEYNLLLKYMDEVKDGYEELISFDDFKAADKFSAKQTEIKNKIDSIVRS